MLLRHRLAAGHGLGGSIQVSERIQTSERKQEMRMSDVQVCGACGRDWPMYPGSIHFCDHPESAGPVTFTAFADGLKARRAMRDDPLYSGLHRIPGLNALNRSGQLTQERITETAFKRALDMEKRVGRDTAIICMGLGFIMGVLVCLIRQWMS